MKMVLTADQKRKLNLLKYHLETLFLIIEKEMGVNNPTILVKRFFRVPLTSSPYLNRL